MCFDDYFTCACTLHIQIDNNKLIVCEQLRSSWLLFVTFHITDPTASLSPPETLRRRIVDHQTLPVVCSLFPSGPSPPAPYHMPNHHYPILQHFTCQWTPSNTCIITQHLRLRLHTEQIPHVQFPLPHVYFTSPHARFTLPCVSLYLKFLLPCARCHLTNHYVSALLI